MTYRNVTIEAFLALRDRLINTHAATVSLSPSGDPGSQHFSGSIVGHGVTASCTYDEAEEQLDVTVTKHPFFIPESAVYEGIVHNLKEVVAGPVAVPAPAAAPMPGMPVPKGKAKA